jgi:hypothetical protein
MKDQLLNQIAQIDSELNRREGCPVRSIDGAECECKRGHTGHHGNSIEQWQDNGEYILIRERVMIYP